MRKVIATYRAFTAAQMKARADIPSQDEIVVNADSIECGNTDIIRVKNLLGESSKSIAGICASAFVNIWSAFGPTVRTVVAGILTNSAPSETYLLDSFAGYNHTAFAPHFESVTHDDDVETTPGSSVSFTAQVHLGEIRLVDDDIQDITDPDRGLALTAWDGAALLAVDIHDLSNTAHYLDADKEIIEFSMNYTIPAGKIYSKQYTCKIYLTNNLTGFAADLSNAICQLLEIPDYTKLFKISAANHVYLNGPENSGGLGTFNSGTNTWTFGKWEMKDFQWLTSNGQLSFLYLKLNARLSGSYNHLSLSVKVQRGYYDTDGYTWIGTDIAVPGGVNPVYDGAWNSDPPNEAAGSVSSLDIWDGGTIDTSGYGYRIYFDCNTTTV